MKTVFAFLLSLIICVACQDTKIGTKQIPSSDNLVLNANYFESNQDQAPLILLFHQAGFSRGEYLEIAPKLNALGFDCLAVDQRSGKEVNGVKNNAYFEAKKAGLKTDYPSAYPDLVATLKYAKKNHPNRKILVWGSSYSASLVIILASKYPELIDGVISFSPGEYFSFENQNISSFGLKVNQPVFITSSKAEEKEWKALKGNIKHPKSVFFLPNQKGKHGAKALWKNNGNNTEYWAAVKAFLGQFK